MLATEQPFDILAGTYDQDFSDAMIGRLQRAQVWERLQPVLDTFQRPLHILEINCGTGVDSVKLAGLGHYVFATDASPVMVAKAAEKKAEKNIDTAHLVFEQCSFEDLAAYPFNKKFDLVFSDFGGLNCIDASALKTLSRTLSGLLHENGYLFFVIMGRFCLWETGYYLLRGKLSKAFRRKARYTDFEVDGKHMPVYYYSPKAFKKLFSNFFEPVNNFAIGLFVPPSYLESFFLKHRPWLKMLKKLDDKIAGPSFMSGFSDHYCMILKRGAIR